MKSRRRRLMRSVIAWGALGLSIPAIGCARGRAPTEPPSCPDEIGGRVSECISQRFVEEGEVGWRLDVQSVIDRCIELNASLPCDGGLTCPADASVVVTPESWPAICDTDVRERFDSEPSSESADVPPSVAAAVEQMRASCPAGTCRVGVSAFLLDFGGRPSVLELDAAAGFVTTRIQAPQTWELHIGTISDRSLSPPAIDTVLEPFGMSGAEVTQTLVTQSEVVQLARYERLLQDRRERVVQHAIIALARRADVSLLILLEVDLTQV